MTTPNKIREHQVTIHDWEALSPLGDRARVHFDFNWDRDGSRLEIRPQHGYSADFDSKPEYGLGKTLREHEESHISDMVTIAQRREPSSTLRGSAYDRHMQHTLDLLQACTDIHTDQSVTSANQKFVSECRRLLDKK